MRILRYKVSAAGHSWYRRFQNLLTILAVVKLSFREPQFGDILSFKGLNDSINQAHPYRSILRQCGRKAERLYVVAFRLMEFWVDMLVAMAKM
jgi:hypothetical protein